LDEARAEKSSEGRTRTLQARTSAAPLHLLNIQSILAPQPWEAVWDGPVANGHAPPAGVSLCSHRHECARTNGSNKPKRRCSQWLRIQRQLSSQRRVRSNTSGALFGRTIT